MSTASAAPPSRPPATAAYDRLTEVFPRLAVACGPLPRGDGWITAAALAAGGPAVTAFSAWDAERSRREYGRVPRPDVAAGFGLYRYAWSASLLLTLPWFLHRRVPAAPLAAVAVRRGLRTEIAFTTREFTCLPDDPAAGLPDASVAADEESLRQVVREGLAGHLGPVLEGFGPWTRRGSRALWGLMTDATTEGLWHLGKLLGDGEEARARAELGLLLPHGTPPYAAGGAAFRALRGQPDDPAPPRTRDRSSCCLLYTVRPRACLTCPRTGDAERLQRLTARRST
ncbi:iron-sulfur protein [Streptomyces sp. AV19]|uniref:iron-sulfur protein n=1 Tax=Streptomyces sp. AV19 TaxID=2793068 RepID=UPI0018FF0ED3|nr:iron-sulfur protein [Streptomyces sp. AV19]MBH1938416.1 iron-sulfur protein [Streptomyces sp. AV19]MDG4535065.1 iron-sulfur protein [Streptomyces sp. AV19]